MARHGQRLVNSWGHVGNLMCVVLSLVLELSAPQEDVSIASLPISVPQTAWPWPSLELQALGAFNAQRRWATTHGTASLG